MAPRICISRHKVFGSIHESLYIWRHDGYIVKQVYVDSSGYLPVIMLSHDWSSPNGTRENSMPSWIKIVLLFSEDSYIIV